MLLQKIKTVLTRFGSQGSKPLEDSKQDKNFNHKERIDGEGMSDVEKMDRGFNGKTYTINGIEGDF